MLRDDYRNFVQGMAGRLIDYHSGQGKAGRGLLPKHGTRTRER